MKTVVRSKYDQRIFIQLFFFQGLEDFSNLPIHERYRSIIPSDGLLLLYKIHLRILSRNIIYSLGGDVFPVIRNNGWWLNILPRIRKEIFFWSNKGYVRPNKSYSQEERRVFVSSDQFNGLFSCDSIGLG